MSPAEKLRKLLEIVRDEILPLTENEVKRGNGVSGGAVVRADTFTSVMVGSDDRVEDPTRRGEMDALRRFFKLPVRPDPSELIFIATHGPCSMCAAALVVAGFREIWRIWSPEEAERDFCDQSASIMRELFGVSDIKTDNAAFRIHSFRHAAKDLQDPAADELLAEILKRYEALAPRPAPAEPEPRD